MVLVVVVLISSRCRRFPFHLFLSPSPSRFVARRSFSVAKLKTFTSTKEIRSCGRTSHKPKHISRGRREGEPRTGKLSKKLAKAERDWHSGMSRTSHVRVWDVRAARAVHENKKKLCQDEEGARKRDDSRKLIRDVSRSATISRRNIARVTTSSWIFNLSVQSCILVILYQYSTIETRVNGGGSRVAELNYLEVN